MESVFALFIIIEIHINRVLRERDYLVVCFIRILRRNLELERLAASRVNIVRFCDNGDIVLCQHALGDIVAFAVNLDFNGKIRIAEHLQTEIRDIVRNLNLHGNVLNYAVILGARLNGDDYPDYNRRNNRESQDESVIIYEIFEAYLFLFHFLKPPNSLRMPLTAVFSSLSVSHR